MATMMPAFSPPKSPPPKIATPICHKTTQFIVNLSKMNKTGKNAGILQARLTMTHLDTIIIGGGLAGLTAGLLLQQQGQQVAIYEKSDQIGGRAITRQKNGFHLNLGPHALYRTGAGLPILKSLGIAPKGKLPNFGKTPLAVTPTGTQVLPLTPATMLGKHMMSGKRVRLMRGIAGIFTANTQQLQKTVWQNWLDQTISDPAVRDFIATVGRLTTYANAPHLMSAGATIEQIKKGLVGNVLYLDGGWQQLINALAEKVASGGIPLHTHASASHISHHKNGVTAHFKDGQTVSAKQIILAVPPKAATELLPQSQALAEAVTPLQPIRAACLTVGLRHLPNPNVTTSLGVGTSFYGVVHSTSAKLAPDGQALLHTAIYLSPDDTRTPAQCRTFLENALDQIQPNWRELCLVEDFFPYLTVSYAVVSASQPRAPIAVADLPDTYVIGDWVESEGMLADGGFASARDVVKMIGAK
jgi:phytoene dehydrogenase-like protein